MTRKEIERQYNRMVCDIVESEMYDVRNTVDRYVCEKCGKQIHTAYRDKGVTPFTIICPTCGGIMKHTQTFDRNEVPDNVEVREWYRPSLKETLKMSDGWIDHIINGGLVLSK